MIDISKELKSFKPKKTSKDIEEIVSNINELDVRMLCKEMARKIDNREYKNK